MKVNDCTGEIDPDMVVASLRSNAHVQDAEAQVKKFNTFRERDARAAEQPASRACPQPDCEGQISTTHRPPIPTMPLYYAISLALVCGAAVGLAAYYYTDNKAAIVLPHFAYSVPFVAWVVGLCV